MFREGALPSVLGTTRTNLPHKGGLLFASVIVTLLSLLAPGTAVSLLGCQRKNSHSGLRKWLQSHQLVTKAQDSREFVADSPGWNCASGSWSGQLWWLCGFFKVSIEPSKWHRVVLLAVRPLA